MGIALIIYIAFGNIAIFSLLILLFHEHGRSFLLLMSSFISFFRYIKLQSYRSFTCFVTLIPMNFILFVAIVKNAISLISFSACLSFVYRMTTDLLELILYLATLLKFISKVHQFSGVVSGVFSSYSSAHIDSLFSLQFV